MAIEHHEERAHGLQPRQYVMIGVILTVITLIELAVSYSGIGSVMIPILLGLSAVKFGAVVAFFMHLRFDTPVLTKLFVGCLVLAGSVLVAVALLFGTDVTFMG